MKHAECNTSDNSDQELQWAAATDYVFRAVHGTGNNSDSMLSWLQGIALLVCSAPFPY